VTRFRAYKMDSIGDSFSYFDGEEFTLIEARYNEANRPQVLEELQACGKRKIDTLHITSWDTDHCVLNDLLDILDELRPKRIEYPGYPPHTDTGKQCFTKIRAYKLVQNPPTGGSGLPPTDISSTSTNEAKKVAVTPEFIEELSKAKEMTRRHIFYWPKQIDEEHPNDCSIVKLFRTGDFNVLSTGDVEKPEIAKRFVGRKIFDGEIDVLILAHHGADNGFTSSTLLDAMKPKVAICGSDYDNKFEHPKKEIRELLARKDIRLCTTKRGDVLVTSNGPTATVTDLMADGEDIQKEFTFKPKKRRIETMPEYKQNDYYRTKPKKPFG